MAQTTPYLGSRISLISRLNIRYEGILYTVDSNEATIALSKVKSFGTEDRPTKHPVKPRDEIFEYIIFKAADIKDLVVCDEAKEDDDVTNDPAILSVTQMPQAAADTNDLAQKHQKLASQLSHGQDEERPRRRNQPQPQSKEPSQRSHRPPPLSGFKHNNSRPFNQRSSAPKEKLKFESDYDFVKANEQFKEKFDVLSQDFADKVVFDATKEEGKPVREVPKSAIDEPIACYNKMSSFFDTISCEALEKAEGRNSRPDWRKERQTNQETFGQYAVRSYNNRRGNMGYHSSRYGNDQPRFNKQQGNQKPQWAGRHRNDERFERPSNQHNRS